VLENIHALANALEVIRKRRASMPTGNVKPVIDVGIALQLRATEHNTHDVFDDVGTRS
jgi:hypothetical protein